MDKALKEITSQEYTQGFVTEIEQEFFPKGLSEDIIRRISARKQEPSWLLEFRLDAFRRWQKMEQPAWGHLQLPEIDYQDIIYFAAPKKDADRAAELTLQECMQLIEAEQKKPAKSRRASARS